MKMLHIYVDASYGPEINSRGIGICVLDHPEYNLAINLNDLDVVISRLELIGVYIVLLLTRHIEQVTIYTDSQHACDPLSRDYELYQSNDWTRANKKKSKIADYDLFTKCSDIIEEHKLLGHKIHIKKCQAHSSIYGNMIADQLANCGMRNIVHSSGTQPFVMNINADLSNIVADHTQIRDTIELLEYIPHPQVEEMPKFPITTFNVYDQDGLSSIAKWSKPLTVLNTIDTYTDVDLENGDEIKLNEVKEHNLFLLCMRCTKMICITYPSNHMINSDNELGDMNKCTIACTLCRSCITSSVSRDNSIDPFKTQDDVERSMYMIMISPSFIKESEYARCAKTISGETPNILCAGQYIAFVRITDILMKCDSTCTVVSVNLDIHKTRNSLHFGFL